MIVSCFSWWKLWLTKAWDQGEKCQNEVGIKCPSLFRHKIWFHSFLFRDGWTTCLTVYSPIECATVWACVCNTWSKSRTFIVTSGSIWRLWKIGRSECRSVLSLYSIRSTADDKGKCEFMKYSHFLPILFWFPAIVNSTKISLCQELVSNIFILFRWIALR